MKVFIDTSAFYALASKNDAFHQKAKELFKKILTTDEPVTTSYVMVETLALLQNRGGHTAALRFLESLNDGNWIEILWVTEALHLEGCRLFGGKNRDISFVDCVSFAAMNRFAISHFFGFDEHFEKAGFLGIGSL
ncbi:MAG: type II toxin-antitoxin system VapC family toxin [Candidatus Xenobiia bacterium LiM19]